MALMPRSDLFLKVVVEHDEDEPPERLAGEICRAIRKMHPVRTAELSSYITHAGGAAQEEAD